MIDKFRINAGWVCAVIMASWATFSQAQRYLDQKDAIARAAQKFENQLEILSAQDAGFQTRLTENWAYASASRRRLESLEINRGKTDAQYEEILRRLGALDEKVDHIRRLR